MFGAREDYFVLVRTMSTAAYGAGKAGATFDPMTFVKKPQVVLKLVCFVSGLFSHHCNYFIRYFTLDMDGYNGYA